MTTHTEEAISGNPNTDAETSEQTVNSYLARVEKMTQEQQEKVSELISNTQQRLDTLQPAAPPTTENGLDQQMEKLYQCVNDELEKAMGAINQQIEAISNQQLPADSSQE